MKLLIATGLYPPDIGGPATYTQMLETHLRAHGIEVMVVPYGTVRRYPRVVRHLIYAVKLIREARRCDQIYALDPISVGIPALIAHFVTKKPFSMRIAGDYAWEQGQQRFHVTDTLDEFVLRKKFYGVAVKLLMWAEEFVAKRAQRIIVPSNYMKRIVTTWGVPPDRIIPIYSALHPLSVTETRESIREIFGYKGIVLVTAGRLVPWKGISMLIEILPELRLTLGEVTLVIIGDGPLEASLREDAQVAGVHDHVRFVGRMPKQTLGTALKGADIFVLNTAYEGMSHQLLEVMDLGIPIITTNVGGNPELITEGINGLLCPFNDQRAFIEAIVRVASHASLREQLVAYARIRVKDFMEEKVVEELAEVFQNNR